MKLEVKDLDYYFYSCDPHMSTSSLLEGEGNINVKSDSQPLLSLV